MGKPQRVAIRRGAAILELLEGIGYVAEMIYGFFELAKIPGEIKAAIQRQDADDSFEREQPQLLMNLNQWIYNYILTTVPFK